MFRFTCTSLIILITPLFSEAGAGAGAGEREISSRNMYNHQANNWSRSGPSCLSDFTGRPVVFDMIKPHINNININTNTNTAGTSTSTSTGEDTVTGTTVLDVGCGEGYCARKVVEMGAALVVGSDISEAMVQCASEVATEDAAKGDSKGQQQQPFYYYCASSCNLLEGLEKERLKLKQQQQQQQQQQKQALFKIPDLFDVAIAVFLFNYLSTDEMLTTMSQIHSALKPGGIFIFSVPHPSMIYCHDPNAIFRLNSSNRGYFSSVNEKLLGHISTIDGKKLNIMSVHKTLNDYMGAIRSVGFDILDIREAGVKEEHMEMNSEFFSSVNDRPLHLVFKLQKKERN